MAILQNTTVSGSLVVTGDLTARQFILSSSVSYFTESFASGSTRFGDSADDVMRVTGSLMMSSSAGLSLYVTGSNGYVGIGTSLPSESLEINGNAFIGYGHTYGFRIGIGDHLPNGNVFGSILWGVASVYGGSNGDAIYIPRQGNNCGHRFYTGNTTPTEKMTITHTGNVGIGTSSPNSSGYGNLVLTIGDGSTKIDNAIELFGSTGVDGGLGDIAFLNGADIGADKRMALIRGYRDGSNTSGALLFYTKNSGTFGERMRINSSGKIVVAGTTAGTALNDSITINTSSSTGYSGVICTTADTQRGYYGATSTGLEIGASTTGIITLWTQGAERMRITSGGNVLIGTTTNSGQKVRIYQPTNGEWNIKLTQINGSDQKYIEFLTTTDSDATVTARGSITYNGTNVLFTGTSDYRLKEDLQEYSGLNIISQLKTYDFKWIEAGIRDYGMMAHELQEVLPNVVTGEKDGMNEDGSIKSQGVDYSKLVPVLVKAIQELSAKVTALENK